MPNCKWTKTEIRTMKALAGRKKTRAIARQLRRTEAAVAQKAFMLGCL
jgi:hypothetical protein